MNLMHCGDKEFYKDPDFFMREARINDKVLVIHTDSGCVVQAVILKKHFESLLKGELF